MAGDGDDAVGGAGKEEPGRVEGGRDAVTGGAR